MHKQFNSHQLADRKAIAVLFQGIFSLILVGPLFLYLPAATVKGSISLADSLFTATSAVCVTGLTVLPMRAFTLFGQLVVLVLIQLGGLGIMVFSIFFLILVSKKISLKDRMMFKDVVPVLTIKNIFRLLRHILIGTLLIESVGALFLYLTTFRDQWQGWKGIYYSIFHAVSAFCNAGFSLFDDSFVYYAKHVPFNGIIMALIILGGIGFVVFEDIYANIKSKIFHKKENLRLRLHTKIVLLMSGALIVFGGVLIYALEYQNVLSGMNIKEKILASMFQSVTARTAGFNTIDTQSLSVPTLVLLVFLMFIGGAPGSCAGGIKVTSFAVIFFLIFNGLQGRSEINFCRRRMSNEVIVKSISLVFISAFVLSLAIMFLTIIENAGMPYLHSKEAFLEVLFECVSAFGTVGLSMGITSKLTILGKCVIIVLMYIGRLGPLSLGLLFIREKTKSLYEYPDENIIIG